MPLQYRQGDPLFLQEEALPAVELVARPTFVVVANETTGHAHRLTSGVVLDAPDGSVYLQLAAPTRVVHQEHDALTLGAGIWLVIRQREYAPGAIRTVLD